ncbi:hypothetical protein PVK06_011543 [Gossypium arboreum]|uniref:Uncharacterized protein n=1 Tax=Gossypium arboreum TaxID=29729 RepID=A0ABR0Q9E8_GOSAR|nr:hypothetical protein PVK06_011543 [Gossypium arboreum]
MYAKNRDLALRRSLQKNFSKPMPPFLVFLLNLLSSDDSEEEPNQLLPVVILWKKKPLVRRKLLRMGSKNMYLRTLEATATTTTTTADKGKTSILVSSPTSVTEQDKLIDQLMLIL